LSDLVGDLEPGDTVTLEIGSPGAEIREIEVELGEHPDEAGRAYLGIRYSAVPRLAPFSEGTPMDPFHEFDLDDLPEGHWDGFGFDEHGFALPPEFLESGAVIERVVAGSPAEEAGLLADDVVSEIDGEAVESPMHLSEAIASHEPGDEISLLIARQGGEEKRLVNVTLGEHPDDPGKAYLGVVLGGFFRMEGFREGDHLGEFEFYHRDRPYGVPPEAWPRFDRFRFDFDELPFDLDDLFDGAFEEQFHFEFPPLEDGCEGEPGCGDNSA
jgi:hypothetical protein